MERRKLKEMENSLTWNIITVGYKKMRGGGSVQGTLNRRNAFERRWWWWWWFRANEKQRRKLLKRAVARGNAKVTF